MSVYNEPLRNSAIINLQTRQTGILTIGFLLIIFQNSIAQRLTTTSAYIIYAGTVRAARNGGSLSEFPASRDYYPCDIWIFRALFLSGNCFLKHSESEWYVGLKLSRKHTAACKRLTGHQLERETLLVFEVSLGIYCTCARIPMRL